MSRRYCPINCTFVHRHLDVTCRQILQHRLYNLTHFSLQGDSGGPLICDGMLAGVTSYSSNKCVVLPSVYTRVSSYYQWIQKTMDDNHSVPA